MSAGHKWKPLQRASAVKPPSEELIASWMKHHGLGREEILRLMKEDEARCERYINDLYQVEVRRDPHGGVHINIRRRDGFIGRDWRHFQQIKNEILGPECEAVELYPAESRLVDTSNKYHLWGHSDPKVRIPVGFPTRDVQFGDDTQGGLRQRPPMQKGR